MHDIDRTQAEFESDFDDSEPDEFEFEEESDSFDAEPEGSFDDAEEMEMAADLLGVTDDAELEQLLGGWIKKASRAVRRAVKSPVGRALMKRLKPLARRALPWARRALPWARRAAGAWLGGPAGAALFGEATSTLGQEFGLELEGLSPEDQEFEVAKRVVRVATEAARNALLAPEGVSPEKVAKDALVRAAQKHAPGLLRGAAASVSPVSGGSGRSGRWIRRGRKIILYGV